MARNRLLMLFYGMVITFFLVACSGDDGKDGTPGAAGAPGAPGTDANTAISLKLIGSTAASADNFDESAAEIVAYHPASLTAYVVNSNAKAVDMVGLSDPSSPAVLSSQIDVASDVIANLEGSPDTPVSLGNVNSVDVYGDYMAVAIDADVKQDDGYVAFYSVAGGSPALVSVVKAGALPDKVGFSPDGNYVVVANEGEPNDDYSNDPEGSITVVDVSGGFDSPVASQAGFEAFNGGGLEGPVRISAKAQSVAQDLEPEFIAFSEDSSTAFATLQENNALAIVDLATAEVTAVLGIGFKITDCPATSWMPVIRMTVSTSEAGRSLGLICPTALMLIR